MTIRSWAFFALLAATACDTSVEHSNPYDPASPPSNQAKAKLVGRIVFEDRGDGDDRSGARISVKGVPSVFTAADGTYTVLGVLAGTYSVEASQADYEPGLAFPVVVTLSPESAVVSVPDITLRRARSTVRGTALLEGASRSSGIVVSLSPGGGATQTDDSGAYALPQVSTGTYEISFSKAGFADLHRPGVVVTAAGATVLDPVTLALRKDSSIRGTVALEMAASPTTASVKLVGTDVNGSDVPRTLAPDASGGFAFDELPPGTYQVQVSEPSFEPVALPTVVLGPGQSVTLPPARLSRLRGSLSGRYALAQAKSHEGVQVGVQGLGAVATVGASTLTDAGGSFTFLSLPVGTYQVTARKGADWSSDDQSVEVQAGPAAHLNADPVALSVVATARVLGKALVDKGTAAGTRVWLRGTDLRGQAFAGSFDTGSDGAFQFAALVAGTYQLSYERGSFEAASSPTFAVGTGETVSAPDALLRVLRGDVVGQVTLSAGSVTSFLVGPDAPGVRVELDDEAGVQIASTVTDASGAYQFTGVAVSVAALGKHQVKASREYFTAASVDVVVAASGSTRVGPLALSLSAGSVEGQAFLNDRLDPSGRLPSHVGVSISVTGVAFNGTAYSKAGGQSAQDGTWSLRDLPPGTYEVHLAADDRRCEGGGTFPVRPGEATGTGDADCFDTVPPGPVVLESVPAWATSASLQVAVQTAASDVNLRGYQFVQGRLPDWTAAAGPAVAGPFAFALLENVESTLWVRAVDWCGNAGPETYVTSRYDSARPATPTIHLPRASADADGRPVSYLNATTTSVTLTGAEGDPTFETYLACSAELTDPLAACDATPSCTLAPSAASFVLQLTPGRRTCVWAQSRDLAQRTAAAPAFASAICDLSRPSAPKIAPVYESSQFTVRAAGVDLFVEAGPVDLPLGDLNSTYKGVDYLEVDSGGGFLPLCPGCRAEGAPDTWDPCSPTCPCDDARLRCSSVVSAVAGDAGWAQARRFVGVHVPLAAGALNRVSVRAVDLAGNTGDGASLTVGTEGMKTFAEGTGAQSTPRFYKDTVAFTSNDGTLLYRLGEDRLPQGDKLAFFQAVNTGGGSVYVRGRSCSDSASQPESFAALGEPGLVFATTSDFSPATPDGYRALDVLALLPGGDPAKAPVVLRQTDWTKSPMSVPTITNVAVAGSTIAWVETQGTHRSWGVNPNEDQKELWACRYQACSHAPPCTPAEVCQPVRVADSSGIVGPGHVSGLRAGGNYFLWAAEALAGCDNPRYRWRLAYAGDGENWTAGASHQPGDVVWTMAAPGHAYRATTAGASASSEPATWPVAPGGTVTDGSVTWREMTATFDGEQAAVSPDGTLVFTADNGRDTLWAAATVYSTYQLVRPTTANGHLYRVTKTRGTSLHLGQSGAQEPAWPTASRAEVQDGELTWMEWAPTDTMSTPATYRIHSAGPDGVWSTGDEPATVENVSRVEITQGGLAVERGRAIAISYGIDGTTITDWEAAPDGRFVGEESYLRHLPAAGGEPHAPEIDHGLLVYSYGSNSRSDLVAVDLSTLRWESATAREVAQAVADDGTVLFANDDLFDRSLVAHRPDGSVSSMTLPGYLGKDTRVDVPPFQVTGEDLLYLCDPKVDGATGLCALNAGPDGQFFTGDEPAPKVLDWSTELREVAVGGGNAFYVLKESGSYVAYLLRPAAPTMPLTGRPSLLYATRQQIVPTSPNVLAPWYEPSVSGRHLVWSETDGANQQSYWLQYLGGAGAPTRVQLDVAGLPCLAGERILAADSGLLVRCQSGPLVAVYPGPNGRFDSVQEPDDDDDRRVLPMGDLAVQDSDGGRNSLAFTGDQAAFIATSPTRSAQVYVWDRARNSRLRKTSHFSDKSSLQMAPSGRMAWSDTLFNGYSTFVWLP